MFKIHGGHRPDYFLLTLIFVLTIVGLVVLSSASSELGKKNFNDSYYYLKHQILYGLSFGAAGFLVAYFANYKILKKLALPGLILAIGFLALVFTQFGFSAQGAARWVRIGPATFQPAEFLKLAFIVYIAAWLTNSKMNRNRDFSTGLLPFLVICGVVATLLFLQPATSTVAILMLAGGIVYFLNGAKLRYVLGTAFLGMIVLAMIVYFTPYRLNRVMGFLNPETDVLGSNYQRNQALSTIGSGGLWGEGYGASTKKYSLPEPIGDSVFAVAAGEFGFAGSGTLVVLFGLLVFRLVWIAKNLRDRFGQLMLIGFASLIALQSLVNMAAISGIIPLTGVPLPFISYGGTALAVFLTMGGIAVNVSKHT